MSEPIPPFDIIAAIRGELPPAHPDFGPFGDPANLETAVELIGPLHKLRTGPMPYSKPGPCGGLTWTDQVMRALLWTIAQHFNEALTQDIATGTWKAHQGRMEATRKAAASLAKALDRLQPWERQALSIGSSVDLSVFIKSLTKIRKVANAGEKEADIATTPHRYFHGSPKARLASALLELWKMAPHTPPPSREGRFLDFVQAIARLALQPDATEQEQAMDRAIRDALSPRKARTPYPLTMGQSTKMGWGWDEASGQKER